VDDVNTDRANVIIVGPNEQCRAGFEPRDWAIQGPQGPAGPAGATGETGPAAPVSPMLSSDPPSFAELSDEFNFSVKNTKTLKKSTVLNTQKVKGVVSPKCPSTHPKVLGGGYETTGVVSAFAILINQQVIDGKAWQVSAATEQTTPWQLTSYIVCKK
jgi:hypothetical protein